ncbi:MAG: flagellar basal body rod protein FlgF [Gammaproteobacteria bacterium]|nr:flagellar basal body rod protein FlgF [Gammaproteobacteria bacterium]
MDRMVYVAMTGAREAMHGLAVNANNLANVTTPGFRADLAQARSMPVFGPGHPTRAYAMTERPGHDLNPSTIHTTGRPLDVAIGGAGWLGVLDAQGNEAYTRRGDFQTTVNGILVNGAGQPVLGNGGPIALPPAQAVEIAGDGTISILPMGQNANALVTVDRLKLVNPPGAEMEKGEDGLFRRRDGVPAEADAAVQVVSGGLETSNVSAVAAMTEMMTLARNFEFQIKVMETAKETSERAATILRLS